MNLILLLLLSANVLFAVLSSLSVDELIRIDKTFNKASLADSNDESKIAEIANSTYGEDQNKLHKAIFKKYRKEFIPVKSNSSLKTLDILLHVYINHIYANDKEQTMTFEGQLFASWMDSVAVWNPAEFNNVRKTYARIYDIWSPNFKVANSARGVTNAFDFSKRSHATLIHQNNTLTKVEVYPRFSIKVGCFFNFANYPYDETTCPLSIYVPENLARIRLRSAYNFESSILLNYGHTGSTKTAVSDWVYKGVNTNISFFLNGNYSEYIPIEGSELAMSWSVYNCYITIQRFSGYFYITAILPFIGCWLISLSTFFFKKRSQSAVIMIANLFIQSIYLHDMIRDAPSSTLNPPKIITVMTVLFFCSALNLFANLFVGANFLTFKEFRDFRNKKEINPIIKNPQENYLDYTINNLIDFAQELFSKEPITNKEPLEQGITEVSATIVETEDSKEDVNSNSSESIDLKISRNDFYLCNTKLRYLVASVYALIFLYSFFYIMF
uniref:Neur_chan_LBD domain-containing protein n=1 Tax=Rhabditophanes sp. KR3021 TaxID=114890 RepID=A0AC35TNK4_9BILA